MHAIDQSVRARTYIPNVGFVNISVFVWLSLRRISNLRKYFHEWLSYGLCTLDLYVRAHAHWPNVTQTYLIAAIVIKGVVAAVVDVLRINWGF